MLILMIQKIKIKISSTESVMNLSQIIPRSIIQLLEDDNLRETMAKNCRYIALTE